MIREFSAGDACSDWVPANSLLLASFIVLGEATIATLETSNPGDARKRKTAQTKKMKRIPIPLPGLCFECSAEFVNWRATAIPFVM